MSLLTPPSGSPPLSEGGVHVVLTRWVMLIAIAYAVVLSAEPTAPFWPHQVIVAAILLSNLALSSALSRGRSWEDLSGWTTGIDILAVALAIAVAGNVTAEFYLIFFVVLIAAAVVDRTPLLMAIAALASACYAVWTIAEVGGQVMSETGFWLRIPVLLAVALYFGTAIQAAREEQQRQRRKLNLERGRALRALAEMGRLALSSRSSQPVLYELAGWVQEICEVDRCSLIVFDHDDRRGFLAASGDDPGIEVRALDVDEYPELQPVLAAGAVIEIHPGRPADLWEQVQRHLPDTSPFRTFLVIPVERDDEVLGAFYLRDGDAERSFSEDHVAFCRQAARMVAAFIHEHELLDQLKEARAALEEAGLPAPTGPASS